MSGVGSGGPEGCRFLLDKKRRLGRGGGGEAFLLYLVSQAEPDLACTVLNQTMSISVPCCIGLYILTCKAASWLYSS